MTSTSYELSPEELAEWERRTSPSREHSVVAEGDAWADPLWRICNIYTCLSPEGETVHFVPSPEQCVVIWCIWVKGWQRIIIPKARQLGMSLTLCLMALDEMVFSAGFQGALIDKTQPDCAKKMEEKIRFSYKNLLPEIRSALNVTADNDSEFTVESVKKSDYTLPSSYQAGVTFRGGTVRWLHISEWGTIQNDPRTRDKSVEIKTGAVPAVERAEDGVCVIETTWKGGLDGEIGPYVSEALSVPDEEKGPKSWRILFFGWQTEPTYRQTHGQIDGVSAEYFREIEKAGVVLSNEQKLWYAEKRRTATSAQDVKQEYPTLVHECWEQVPVGSIYGRWIEEARATGRISNFLPPRDFPVHTWWDIGHPLNTVTILTQITPTQIRIIDCLMEIDMTPEQRAAWLRQLGWDYGKHFFPHDADSDSASTGMTPISRFRQILGPQCQVVPKCRTVWDGIGIVRVNFPRFVFAADTKAKLDDRSTAGARVNTLLDHLGRYRAERETKAGIAKDEPVHDRYSHASDALRQMGQAMAGGLIENANHVGDARGQQAKKLEVKFAGSWG